MELPSDNEARELALDITRSHHVEAPAGSGKTMLLVARFLRLLGCVSHPYEILALTFTNKAAGEMKTRIGGLLQKAHAGALPTSDLEAALLRSASEALRHHADHRFLLLSPEGLQVMTFHGFCYTLIKRAPLEAGISPVTAVLDEEEQGRLLDTSMRKMVHDIISMPEGTPERAALENRLLRLNNRLPALVDEIKELVIKRDLFLDLVEALRSYPSLDDFAEALNQRMGGAVTGFLKEAREFFAEIPLFQHWDLFWQHLDANGAPNARFLPQTLPGATWNDLSVWKAIADVLATRDGKPRQQTGPNMGGFYRGFSKGPWGAEVKNLPSKATRLLCSLKDLPGSEEPLTDIEALADLIILVARAVATYERRCQQRHVLDFVALEQAALRTMGEDVPSDLQLFLDHRIQQILVDEFQDTSRSQWTLIQRLCAGWTPGDGRTVFLVGDPKQSVYAFRKAEVRLFMDARKGVPTSGQGLLPVKNIQLAANFRSQDPLVAWTNQFFGHTVMANPEPAFDEVPFQPSVAYPRPEGRREGAAVSLNIFFKGPSTSSPAEAEAQWLATSIRHVLERSPQTSIGILLFTRNRLPFYLNALRQTGQPVRVKEGLRIIDRPEVMHLYQMARALCRPHDDLAWVSVLRSPWSWVDSPLLLKIARLSPSAWSQKLEYAATEHPEMAHVHRALVLGRRRVGRDALAEVVRQVWMALSGPEKVAARFGAEGVANCRLFFEFLESVDTGIPEEGLLRLDGVLETLYAPEAPDAAGVPIDIMTVHTAKGLEFDVVFLPFLDWRPLAVSQPPPYLLERSPEPPGLPLIAMAPDRRLAEPDPGYLLLKRLADGRRLAEAKRLLYVGVTRARRKLFLSGLATHTQGRMRAPTDSPLAWLLEHTTHCDGKLISTLFNPVGQNAGKKGLGEGRSLPNPVSFKAQPLPYMIEVPSELVHASTYEQDLRSAEIERAEHAAIRGTITHRLVEALRQNGALPENERIAIAIASEGMNPAAAMAMAQEIADELAACQKEPFFKWLVDPTQPGAESEYAVEAIIRQGTIHAGVLDFVKQDENDWWIVDFKTSRPAPGQAETAFVKAQIEYYRPQLTAYCIMLAKAKGINKIQVKTGLYFTSLQQWHEIKQ